MSVPKIPHCEPVQETAAATVQPFAIRHHSRQPPVLLETPTRAWFHLLSVDIDRQSCIVFQQQHPPLPESRTKGAIGISISWRPPLSRCPVWSGTFLQQVVRSWREEKHCGVVCHALVLRLIHSLCLLQSFYVTPRMHKLLDWDNATNLLSREASLRAMQLILSTPQQQQQQQQQQQSLVGDNVAAAAAIMTRHGEAIVPLGRQLPEQCPHDERVHRAELQLMAQAHRISLLEEQHQYSATGVWASNRLPTSQHPLYHQVHQDQSMEQQFKMLLAMQAHNRQRQQHHHHHHQQLLAEHLHQQQRELNAAVMLQCLATVVSPPAVATSHAHHLRPRSDHHQERAPFRSPSSSSSSSTTTTVVQIPPPPPPQERERNQQAPELLSPPPPTRVSPVAAVAPWQPERRLRALLVSDQSSGSSSSSSSSSLDDKNVPLCLPVPLAVATDEGKLSPLQALLRHQILVFEASENDVTGHVRGRHKAIRVDQVGIQCRHCAYLPLPLRHKGFAYFPTSVWGYYQASQNMLATHMMQQDGCSVMPRAVQQEFAMWQAKNKGLGSNAKPSGAGRAYWAKSAESLGLVDREGGVYFVRHLPTDLGPPKPPTASHVYRTTTKKRAHND
jgi:hypothetical protein